MHLKIIRFLTDNILLVRKLHKVTWMGDILGEDNDVHQRMEGNSETEK